MKNKIGIKWLLLIVFAFAVMSGGSSGCGGSSNNDISEARARELIQPFYELFMSSKWKDGVRDFDSGFVNHDAGWLSYDNNPKSYRTGEGPNNITATKGFLGGYMFVKIPDIEVKILEVWVDGDWIFVRSELTGSFNYDPELFREEEKNYFDFLVGDKPFNIMALDHHRFEKKSGELKLVELYHSEHWADAVVQSWGDDWPPEPEPEP